MSYLVGEVRVNLRHHARVTVPHQFRHLSHTDAVDQCLGRPGMPGRVRNEMFQVRELLPEPPEAAADAVTGERLLPARTSNNGPSVFLAISLRVSSTIAGVR